MDPDPPQVPVIQTKPSRIFARCCCCTVIFITVSFILSFLFGSVIFAIENLKENSPISVQATCRIVSSSVDIKSSKVCELGFLNYKAKNVLYPMSKAKKTFRCHDDYYWASIFEVEYKEYFSGQLLHGVAEAPKEALPIECRPSFGNAWSTKLKFKVNETYNCRYALGTHKADIYTDNLFNCKANEPSLFELIRRFLILFMRSSILDMASARLKGTFIVISSISGMLFGMFTVISFRTLHYLFASLNKRWQTRKQQIQSSLARLRRVCILVAYFSAASWLMLEYGKMIGLKISLFFWIWPLSENVVMMCYVHYFICDICIIGRMFPFSVGEYKSGMLWWRRTCWLWFLRWI